MGIRSFGISFWRAVHMPNKCIGNDTKMPLAEALH